MIKSFPPIPLIYSGPAPVSEEDFQTLSILKPSLIVNLAKEYSHIIPKEKLIAHTIFSNISDYSIPQDIPLFSTNLKILNNYILNNNIIFIHCRAGIGRTSLFIASYIKSFYSNLNYLQLTNEYLHGPETTAQINFVNNFKLI
jgi:protein tyrosine phosphatase